MPRFHREFRRTHHPVKDLSADLWVANPTVVRHKPTHSADRLTNNTILAQITWVCFLDKTEGATDRSGQKLRLVAGACQLAEHTLNSLLFPGEPEPP